MFKNKFSYSFLIVITSMILLSFSYIQQLNRNIICNAEYITNRDLKDENIQLKHQIEELNGTIDMLKDALNELGATTSDDVINAWSKGIQARNGYLQYYVLCDDMKNKFIEELSKSQRISSWVTGYSSTWVSSYNVVNTKK